MSGSALLALPSELIGSIMDNLDIVECLNVTAVCSTLKAQALSSLSRSEYIYLDIFKAHQRGVGISSNSSIPNLSNLRTLVISTYPTQHRNMTIALRYFSESRPDVVHCHFTPLKSGRPVWMRPEIMFEHLKCGTLVLSGVGGHSCSFSTPKEGESTGLGSRCTEIVQIVNKNTQYLAMELYPVSEAGPKLSFILKNQGGIIKSNGDDYLSLTNQVFYNVSIPWLLESIRDERTHQTVTLACQEPRTDEEMDRLERRIRDKMRGESDAFDIGAFDVDDESVLGDALSSYESIIVAESS